MSKENYLRYKAFVDGFGYLHGERKLYEPDGKAKYLAVEIGDLRFTVYGRAIDDFRNHRDGDLVYFQGQLLTCRDGHYIQLSRYTWASDLFVELVDCNDCLSDALSNVVERTKPKIGIAEYKPPTSDLRLINK